MEGQYIRRKYWNIRHVSAVRWDIRYRPAILNRKTVDLRPCEIERNSQGKSCVFRKYTTL